MKDLKATGLSGYSPSFAYSATRVDKERVLSWKLKGSIGRGFCFQRKQDIFFFHSVLCHGRLQTYSGSDGTCFFFFSGDLVTGHCHYKEVNSILKPLSHYFEMRSYEFLIHIMPSYLPRPRLMLGIRLSPLSRFTSENSLQKGGAFLPFYGYLCASQTCPSRIKTVCCASSFMPWHRSHALFAPKLNRHK